MLKLPPDDLTEGNHQGGVRLLFSEPSSVIQRLNWSFAVLSAQAVALYLNSTPVSLSHWDMQRSDTRVSSLTIRQLR
jgi:hypothetical protein